MIKVINCVLQPNQKGLKHVKKPKNKSQDKESQFSEQDPKLK